MYTARTKTVPQPEGLDKTSTVWVAAHGLLTFLFSKISRFSPGPARFRGSVRFGFAPKGLAKKRRQAENVP
jgi:hypothetical protein